MASKLSEVQILQDVHDPVTSSLKTTIPTLTTAIEVSAADGDSIQALELDTPPGAWDYFEQALSVSDTVVTRTYRNGGSGGTVVGTVVYTYSTSARTFLTSLQRSWVGG